MKTTLIVSALISSSFLLSACSTPAPKDDRLNSFGQGLPQQHNEQAEPQYETQPLLKEQADLSDSDKDGVINERDQCHEHSANVVVDNKGCEQTLSYVQSFDLDVQFQSGSALIDKQYLPNIKRLADAHLKQPEFALLIEGHTDNSGSRSENMILSKARADAVASVLVDEYGVQAADIYTAGFGPDEPIASNDTKDGKQKNRRMVAHLVLRDRFLSKHYDLWTVELGVPPKTKQKLFNAN